MNASDPEELAAAACRGDLDRAKALLAAGADINVPAEVWTPLHAAVEAMDVPMMELLLSAGADPNLEVRGFSPLHHAVDVEWDSVVQVLQRQPREEELPEPVATACLLRAGADPHRRDEEGQTALEFASRCGHLRASALIKAYVG